MSEIYGLWYKKHETNRGLYVGVWWICHFNCMRNTIPTFRIPIFDWKLTFASEMFGMVKWKDCLVRRDLSLNVYLQYCSEFPSETSLGIKVCVYSAWWQKSVTVEPINSPLTFDLSYLWMFTVEVSRSGSQLTDCSVKRWRKMLTVLNQQVAQRKAK